MLLRSLPVALLVAGLPAAAQLDLPGKPAPKPKDPAQELVPLKPPGGDVTPKPATEALDLPGAQPAPVGSEVAAVGEAGPAAEAAVLFGTLAKTRAPAEVEATFQHLFALGPPVLPRSREVLLGEHGPSVSVAGRLCLRLGTGAERAAVAERLARPLAADVAVVLFEELLERDPVLSSPEYVAGLLDHPGAALRARAVRELEARGERVPLSALAPLFSSSRTAARAAALELVGRHPDPLAWNLLASRLGDPSAQLARRAAELLAALDGAEALLLERAFPPAERPGPLEWTRARAYALLALVEREERLGTALLEGGERAARVESLRAGLTSSQPLVVGAAAVALARIGFRASAAQCGPWLEREVPHQLVRAGTGAEFHADFSSLERPALRGLTLLTGENFGADGDAWRAWWVESAAGFRARHARIELGPRAAEELVVAFRARDGRTLTFVGPGAPPAARDPGRLLRLDAAAGTRLLARLEGAGVFGPERLPTARRGGEVALRVAVGGAEKAFAPARGEAWLAELAEELERLVEEERWQLYPGPAVTDLEAWWRGEAPRWAGLEPLARARALVALLLEALRRAQGVARDELVGELTRLYQDAGVPAAEDFEPLLAALGAEPAFPPRGTALCELARLAAGVADGAAPEPSARERLLGLVLARFGPEADAVLARLAQDLDLRAAEQLSEDTRARARALGAAGLARRAGQAEAVRLRSLLGDPEPSVRLALLRALASAADPALAGALRAELAETARSGATEERLAALAVLAPLGGTDVRDLALEAIGDPDVRVQTAGVAALAELADPASASLLASLYARGPSSPHHAEARRGLRRIGAAGREECRRLARSASTRARREAALFLAETLDPAAAGLLLECLAVEPEDERLLRELGVLAGQDFTAEAQPSAAVAAWWELVVHDEPLAWLLAAAEREGLSTPPRALFQDAAHPEVLRFLLALAERPRPVLVERAARELEQRLGLELARPATAGEGARFLAELQAAVQARLGE